MNTTTHATGTVVAGQLQLDEPLGLPDQSRVSVTVEPATIAADDWRQRMTQGLKAMQNLKTQQPIGSGGMRLTREQLHERR